MIMCRKLLPMASNEEVERAIDQKWWVSLLGKGYLFKMGGGHTHVHGGPWLGCPLLGYGPYWQRRALFIIATTGPYP